MDFEDSFLNQQCPSGMPPHCLTLKIGCFILLLRNLSPNNGLLNGTRLVVINLHQHFIEERILTRLDGEF